MFAGEGVLYGTGNAMEMSPNAPGDSDRITEQISVEIRHAFVRKVFAILAVQILVGTADTFLFDG